MSDDWEVVEEAEEGWPTPNKYTEAIARLREREALNELWEARYREAEARVKELESSERQAWWKADHENRRAVRLKEALRESETLLTNYLMAGKFPPGSDCEEVRDIARRALGEK